MTDAGSVRCLFVGERPEPGLFVAPTMGRRWIGGKPEGGLWACREVLGEPSAWLLWCIATGQTHLLASAACWVLEAPSPRLLTLDGVEDYWRALRRYPYEAPWMRVPGMMRSLDFPRIAETYDGVELTARGLDALRFADPGLPGWDVPSLVWLRWCFGSVERHVAGTGAHDAPDGPACGRTPARREDSPRAPESTGGP